MVTRPTDPAKLAALRANDAARAQRYRARQKADRTGQPVPESAAPRAPATYRPPRVAGVVQRAARTAATARDRRAEVVAGLPSVRNPATTIYVPREAPRAPAPSRSSAKGQKRQADAIRENARAQRLNEIGRSRKAMLAGELASGPAADRLRETMTKSQQARFTAAARRIAAIPNEALGILFRYEGGQGDYNSAVERVLASPESRDVEEGLDKMDALASLAERAGSMYSPKALGRRLNV